MGTHQTRTNHRGAIYKPHLQMCHCEIMGSSKLFGQWLFCDHHLICLHAASGM